ncbi:MAG UNVERIFIED_CONTAM: hypothetical protein LVR18_24670 [Planctomycetaceae bacterium]|jgi:hypothetical protein
MVGWDISPLLAELSLLWLVVVAGCGSGESRYLPPEEAARVALDAALSSWKGGAKLATITTGPVPVDTFDARWRDGRVLESYEILEYELVEDRPTFRVRVGLKGEAVVEDTFVMWGTIHCWCFGSRILIKRGV